MNTIMYLFLSARPKQWIKNLAVFIPILFWGFLFIPDKFFVVSLGFLIFCGLTSSVYLLNDYSDRAHDALHPGKKNRPIASGKLNPTTALLVSIGLAVASLLFAYILSEYFFIVSLVYILLMTAYSLYLRNIIIIDALVVAFGFVLRVFAGAFVSETPISSWLIICTIGIALLISFGRRRCEVTLLKSKAPDHRLTLRRYPEVYLDVIIASVTAFSLLSYAFFTFVYPGAEIIREPWIYTYLPATWQSLKWLMFTIPVTLYGVLRYLFIIYEKREADSPEEAVFNDKPLLTSLLIWTFIVILVIYVL